MGTPWVASVALLALLGGAGCWGEDHRDPGSQARLLTGRQPAEELSPGGGDERGTKQFRSSAGDGPEWTRRLAGSTTQLANILSSSSFGGNVVEVINGLSKAHVYRALSEHAMDGVAITKMWCMPDEFNLEDESQGRKFCSLDNAKTTIQRMLALQRVTEECGLEDMAPRMWRETVVAEIPQKGYMLQRASLMQDMAPGVSLLSLTDWAKPQVVLDLVERINSTQVVRGAIYDLLFTMCDRHLGNVFVDEAGNIKLIDNDQAFGLTDEHHEMCSLSSVFLPTTQCHAIAALGKFYAKRRRINKTPEPPNPGVTLDYRCHAPRGEIGTDYPPSVRKCLEKFAGMRAESIQQHYGFPDSLSPYHLKVRAWTMLHKGFEFALYQGAPQNPGCEVFPKSEPCCAMGLAPDVQRTPPPGERPDPVGHYLQCLSPRGWAPNTTIPEGCSDGVQLGEDLSYTGAKDSHHHCRACELWGAESVNPSLRRSSARPMPGRGQDGS